RITGETLIISLAELGFFNSGEATLLPEGVASLGRIARILNSKGFEIRVEGHTDNVPIHTARFRSNWELSTARATEVVSLLVEQYDFDPRKISAAGYSEFHPVASNDKPEGRRQNRRVDVVVVSRSTPEVAPKVVAEASSP
ncbi:MAG TPA: OmpA family protein, partial [Terriglobales bacterium]|nr:OmpA family protein [Terriglobales bacterium]